MKQISTKEFCRIYNNSKEPDNDFYRLKDCRCEEYKKIIKLLIQLRPNDAILDNLLILELDNDGLVNLYQSLADESLSPAEGKEERCEKR